MVDASQKVILNKFSVRKHFWKGSPVSESVTVRGNAVGFTFSTTGKSSEKRIYKVSLYNCVSDDINTQ